MNSLRCCLREGNGSFETSTRLGKRHTRRSPQVDWSATYSVKRYGGVPAIAMMHSVPTLHVTWTPEVAAAIHSGDMQAHMRVYEHAMSTRTQRYQLLIPLHYNTHVRQRTHRERSMHCADWCRGVNVLRLRTTARHEAQVCSCVGAGVALCHTVVTVQRGAAVAYGRPTHAACAFPKAVFTADISTAATIDFFRA